MQDISTINYEQFTNMWEKIKKALINIGNTIRTILEKVVKFFKKNRSLLPVYAQEIIDSWGAATLRPERKYCHKKRRKYDFIRKTNKPKSIHRSCIKNLPYQRRNY